MPFGHAASRFEAIRHRITSNRGLFYYRHRSEFKRR